MSTRARALPIAVLAVAAALFALPANSWKTGITSDAIRTMTKRQAQAVRGGCYLIDNIWSCPESWSCSDAVECSGPNDSCAQEPAFNAAHHSYATVRQGGINETGLRNQSSTTVHCGDTNPCYATCVPFMGGWTCPGDGSAQSFPDDVTSTLPAGPQIDCGRFVAQYSGPQEARPTPALARMLAYNGFGYEVFEQ